MDKGVGPTSSALEESRERQRAAGRWLRWLGAALLLLVVVTASVTEPRPALAGRGLGVLICLVILVTGAVVALSWGRSRPLSVRSRAVAFACLAAGFLSSVVLAWLQPAGPGWVGAFVSIGAAAARLPRRSAGWFLVLSLAILGVAQWLGPGGSLLSVIITEIGAGAFFLLADLTRRLREGQERAEQLLAELEQSREAQAEAAAARERDRLAREMHDVLAHSLSGLVLQLESARLLVAQDGGDARTAATVERAHHLARSGLEEARRAIGMLRGDDLPGPDQLERLAGDFEQDSGIACSLTVAGEEQPLPSEARLTLYRAAQEALTNVRKHAHASRVELRLDYKPHGARLTIQDYGERPEPPRDLPEVGNGFGLTGMRERAELLGGELTAAPAGGGWRVDLWLPA